MNDLPEPHRQFWPVLGYGRVGGGNWLQAVGESIHPMETLIIWFGFFYVVNAPLRVLYGYYCQELPRG